MAMNKNNSSPPSYVYPLNSYSVQGGASSTSVYNTNMDMGGLKTMMKTICSRPATPPDIEIKLILGLKF